MQVFFFFDCWTTRKIVIALHRTTHECEPKMTWKKKFKAHAKKKGKKNLEIDSLCTRHVRAVCSKPHHSSLFNFIFLSRFLDCQQEPFYHVTGRLLLFMSYSSLLRVTNVSVHECWSVMRSHRLPKWEQFFFSCLHACYSMNCIRWLAFTNIRLALLRIYLCCVTNY